MGEMRKESTRWGVLDGEDNCWLGDDSGPRLFPDATMARISAQVLGVQLGFHPLRLKAKEFTAPSVRLRDELPTRMGTVDALRRIEKGGAL
jgi:hypothetical protein